MQAVVDFSYVKKGIFLRLITFHATLELITFLLGKLIGRDRFRQPEGLPCNYFTMKSSTLLTYWTIQNWVAQTSEKVPRGGCVM